MDRLDRCIEIAERFVNTDLIKDLYNKICLLKLHIFTPLTWDGINIELLDEIDEEFVWHIPSFEVFKNIVADVAIQAMYQQSDNSFWCIYIVYNKDEDNVSLYSNFIDEDIEFYNSLASSYENDMQLLKDKSYVGNCTKEFCERIVEHNWAREFDKIQLFDFPKTEFHPANIARCRKELNNLIKDPGKLYSKSKSDIIKYFHKSLIHANVFKHKSPYDGWKQIQSDPETFKDFYRNRLRCSDWFKGHDRLGFLFNGWVQEATYGIGLTTSRKYPLVTYFKPQLAKYIITKWLSEYNTIFDPFSGYSGRMIGALVSGKNYIGQDLCESSVAESNNIYDFIKDTLHDMTATASINIADSVTSSGKYECLFTCPPYENIENWPGVPSVGYSCDKWIDICLSNYKCNRYVFVVDDTIEKYKPYVVEEITNTSHLGANKEYIVVINKNDLKEIYLDPIGDEMEYEFPISEYSKIGMYLYNIFNKEVFDDIISAPICFTDWINLIYHKFGYDKPYIRNVELPKISLKTDSNTVLLACSGGLDSTYQILQLRSMGYDVVLYHCNNANTYENGQSYKAVKEIAEKTGVKLITSRLCRHTNVPYSKHWAENPIKNQMMLFIMIDICVEYGFNKIAMDGSWEFPIADVTCGIDVADAPENYELWLKGINNYVDNLVFIKTPHDISKLDKIVGLKEAGLMDSIYSCLGAGRLNEYRHKKVCDTYNIMLPKHNCGYSCRKCAHHNLLLYYGTDKQYPPEFIEKCWHIMDNNGFNSRNMLFDNKIPLEQRIKNLFVE